MDATKTLMNEHRLIEVMLGCLEAMAERCAGTGELDRKAAADAVWFLRTFADRCHHGKEEAELFPLLESRGLSPDSGPTAVMRAEHVQGRELVGRIEAAIDAAARGNETAVRSFVGSSLELVGLLRTHIQKEDHCLFPMADQAISEADMADLQEKFRKVDEEDIGLEVLEGHVETARRLAQLFGVEFPDLEAEMGHSPKIVEETDRVFSE